MQSGCQAYLASDCDVLVAVGGGSCIDAAKAIAVLAAGGGRIADYAGVGKVTGPLAPTVMVPTTGGSGSDVSQFCVVTDTTRKIKMTIGARALVPDISVTDPQVLTTVPPDITAYTALDVLSHAIESYVSQAANFLSDAQALAAIRGSPSTSSRPSTIPVTCRPATDWPAPACRPASPSPTRCSGRHTPSRTRSAA